jgi:hypothetical protein
VNDIEQALEVALEGKDWDTAKKIADLLKVLRELGVAELPRSVPSPSITKLRVHPTESWASPSEPGVPTRRSEYL